MKVRADLKCMNTKLLEAGFPEFCICFQQNNYALFFCKLCAKNPKLCLTYVNCAILCNILKQKILMF